METVWIYSHDRTWRCTTGRKILIQFGSKLGLWLIYRHNTTPYQNITQLQRISRAQTLKDSYFDTRQTGLDEENCIQTRRQDAKKVAPRKRYNDQLFYAMWPAWTSLESIQRSKLLALLVDISLYKTLGKRQGERKVAVGPSVRTRSLERMIAGIPSTREADETPKLAA